MIEIRRPVNPNALRQVENLAVTLFEGEVNAHKFIVTPGEGISFTGATPVAFFVRADNQRVDLTGALNGDNLEITLSANCYAVPGRYKLTIFAQTEAETAAVYACAGTVQGTRGSEVAGDTEPIVEPAQGVDAETLEMIDTAMQAIHGLYHGNDGTQTLNGLTVTRKGFLYTFNGTPTGRVFVRLNGVELELSATDKSSEWSSTVAQSGNINIPNGSYYLQGYRLDGGVLGFGWITGNGWEISEEPIGRSYEAHYLSKSSSLVLCIDTNETFSDFGWILSLEREY